MFDDLIQLVHPLMPYLETAFVFLKTWWWVALPFILWPPLSFLWLWWRRDLWDAKQKKIFLEIKIPEESLKPIRAMEAVLAGFWQLYSPPNWHEKWWQGQFQLGFSFEIVSIDGKSHFIIRLPERYRNIVESHLYSQYPEAEIFEVPDYVKNVPQDIPNKDWDLWGTDYVLTRKEDGYPIKTYTDFETERETEEEKRIDPLASLLEGMTKLKEGEQLWVQIVARPILGDPKEGERAWQEEAKKLRDKLARRKAPAPPKLILTQIWDLLIHAKPPGQEEKEPEGFPAEMKLTPGERDIVAAIERKISKLGFNTNIRYIYLAKRDVYFSGNFRIAMSYFTNFNAANCNGLKPWGKTITKVKKNWYNWFWFIKRRLYLKKRRLFWHYALRLSPLFPLVGGVYILTTEELATIYHFPSRTVAPAPFVPRVEAKKGEAPPTLPVE